MNEETGYLIFQICFTIPITWMILLWIKYHYISTVCREWNKKLYEYIQHVESQKDSGILKKDYSYLEKMYLYPDEVGIRLIKDWKESDLIHDKFTLFNVNRYHEHQAVKC